MTSTTAERVAALLPRLGAALGVFAAFGAATVVAGRLLRHPPPTRRVPRELWRLFSRAVKALLLTLGSLTALGTMGVDVSALVAGLGLTGFALGFAVRDALSNVLAGVLTLVYQPFRAGGKRHLVPDPALFSDAVTVFASGAAPPAPSAKP